MTKTVAYFDTLAPVFRPDETGHSYDDPVRRREAEPALTLAECSDWADVSLEGHLDYLRGRMQQASLDPQSKDFALARADVAQFTRAYNRYLERGELHDAIARLVLADMQAWANCTTPSPAWCWPTCRRGRSATPPRTPKHDPSTTTGA